MRALKATERNQGLSSAQSKIQGEDCEGNKNKPISAHKLSPLSVAVLLGDPLVAGAQSKVLKKVPACLTPISRKDLAEKNH